MLDYIHTTCGAMSRVCSELLAWCDFSIGLSHQRTPLHRKGVNASGEIF